MAPRKSHPNFVQGQLPPESPGGETISFWIQVRTKHAGLATIFVQRSAVIFQTESRPPDHPDRVSRIFAANVPNMPANK